MSEAKNHETNLLIHELMHVFGFADVYKWKGPEVIMNLVEHIVGEDKIDLTSDHKDTLMNPGNVTSFEIKELTPQDYATLCALYMPKVAYENYESEVVRLMQKINDYKSSTCNKKLEHFKNEDLKVLSHLVEWQGYKAELASALSEDTASLTFTRKVYYSNGYSEWFEEDDYTYKVQFCKNEYTLEIFDKNGRMVDGCEGNVIRTDHFTVLENCQFKNGMPTSIDETNVWNKDDQVKFSLINDMYVFNYNGKPRVYTAARVFNVCKEVTYQNEIGAD